LGGLNTRVPGDNLKGNLVVKYGVERGGYGRRW